MINPGHTLGQVSELTIVTPIRAGQVAILRGMLQTFNTQNIFAPVPAIHFARFVIVTPPDGEVEHDSYLLFVCTYDGDFALLVAALVENSADPLNAIWGHTPGWGGSRPVAAFQDWVLAHAVRANMAYTPYPMATVLEIRRGLAIDEAVQELFDVLRTEPAAHALLAALAR